MSPSCTAVFEATEHIFRSISRLNMVFPQCIWLPLITCHFLQEAFLTFPSSPTHPSPVSEDYPPQLPRLGMPYGSSEYVVAK